MAKNYSRKWAQSNTSNRIAFDDMSALGNDQLMRIVDRELADHGELPLSPGSTVRRSVQRTPALTEAIRRGLVTE